jgi:hypothetical protein
MKEEEQDAREKGGEDAVLTRCAAVLWAVGKDMPAERGLQKEWKEEREEEVEGEEEEGDEDEEEERESEVQGR